MCFAAENDQEQWPDSYEFHKRICCCPSCSSGCCWDGGLDGSACCVVIEDKKFHRRWMTEYVECDVIEHSKARW